MSSLTMHGLAPRVVEGAGVRGAGGRWNAPVSVAQAWRRRGLVVVGLLVAAFLLTVAIGRVTASAGLADEVAGNEVVAPGETLWDVAVATAPADVDVRAHLAELEALNGVRAGEVEAWEVLLIPAR